MISLCHHGTTAKSGKVLLDTIRRLPGQSVKITGTGVWLEDVPVPSYIRSAVASQQWRQRQQS